MLEPDELEQRFLEYKKNNHSKIDYKFNEDNLLREFKKYIDDTYSQHYAKEKIQALEVIIDSGHGVGFCLGSISKYVKRYGKKGSKEDARKDLQKVLHYALLQLYLHDNDL
jgi:phosphomannomutase